MPPPSGARHARRVLLCAVAALATASGAGAARAAGLIESTSGFVETTYSLFSSRTTDTTTGQTTKFTIHNYGGTFNLGVNYDLLPTLNVNAGLNYYKNFAKPTGDGVLGDTEVTRFQPYVWLTLNDPVVRAQVGYSLQDQTLKTSGLPDLSLSRETYAAFLTWRPADLPSTQIRYTRTITQDDPRALLSTTEDYAFLKSEYVYGGLDAYYAGTYLRTDDDIRDVVSKQWSHEGRAQYSTSFLDGRVSLTSDNRVRYTQIENVTQLLLPSSVGLSGLDDTPLDGALAASPALTDGDRTVSAGINLGYPGPGGNFARRNLALDFITAATVGSIQVWVDGWGPAPLPADITGAFVWEIYTSGDNQTWTFHTMVSSASFGPFDRRFEISFPPVTARYVKVVTRPLSGGVIGSTNSSQFPNIFVTELQAFADRPSQQTSRSLSQLVQNYSLDVKVILFRTPSLYYRFYGSYFQFDPGGDTGQGSQTRYYVSNGLFYNQRLTPIWTVTANASFEVGSEADETRTAVLYYGALAATPLPTLTDTLVVTGNRQWLGRTSLTNDSVGVYNTAQLYRGIDVSLNFGVVFSSTDDGEAPPLDRRDLLVNVGAGVTPNPALTLTAYYTGKFSHATGGRPGQAGDTTQSVLDLGLSFTPFRALSLSALASFVSEPGQPSGVRYNLGLSWAPFPDGQLQFTFAYQESHFPDQSRIVQPTLRWYLSPRRRSYLEATYQYNKSSTDTSRTESSLISATLKTYF